MFVCSCLLKKNINQVFCIQDVLGYPVDFDIIMLKGTAFGIFFFFLHNNISRTSIKVLVEGCCFLGYFSLSL